MQCGLLRQPMPEGHPPTQEVKDEKRSETESDFLDYVNFAAWCYKSDTFSVESYGTWNRRHSDKGSFPDMGRDYQER